MEFEIKHIDSKQDWDSFMAQAKPQSFLHSWGWGEFNEKMKSKIFRFGVYQNGKFQMAAQILKITARRGSFLFCPHGPIFLTDTNKEEVLKVFVPFLQTMARQEKCSFIRISPLLHETSENKKLFKDLRFRESPIHMHSELAWILDVQPTEDELLMNMRKTTRYCIRKAEKDGVEIVVSDKSDDIELFWQVYKETVDRQNFTPFSKNYLKSEFEIFARDGGALFFFAKYNNEIVAAAMIIFYQGSAFYHHGASTHKYPKITAPYLLQWRVIQEAKKRGCRNYDFWGISPEDKPKHPWAGLSLFKKGFGGQSFPYVHAKDFILSPKYWASWSIETVRRMKRGV